MDPIDFRISMWIDHWHTKEIYARRKVVFGVTNLRMSICVTVNTISNQYPYVLCCPMEESAVCNEIFHI